MILGESNRHQGSGIRHQAPLGTLWGLGSVVPVFTCLGVSSIMKDYKDLVSWQKSMWLAKEIYQLTRLLPNEETYGLASQIRRAAVSIPSNIAEGYGRESALEYARFLKYARGSLYEVETQLRLCEMLQFLTAQNTEYAFSLCGEIVRMLNTMLRRLQGQMRDSE